jgi:hypothetical protein
MGVMKMHGTVETKLSWQHRLSEELWKVGIITAYLFICFIVLDLYRLSLIPGENMHQLKVGLAIGKAAVIAKFILIGEAAKVGTRVSARAVWHRIVWKSLLFWLTVMVLTLLEEIILGWVHDRSALASLQEFLDRSYMAILAPSLVMLLILIPIIAFSELNRALGVGVLKSILQGGEKRPV